METPRQIRRVRGRGQPLPGGMAQVWKCVVLAAILAVLPGFAILMTPADAEQQPSEYQVKAAFLLNFTKFIEWPNSEEPADAPFSICILGDDPFGNSFDRMVEGETVNGRKLVIQRIRRQEARRCQIVFAGQGERDTSKLLAGLGPGILTVGEGDQFLREGGMIAFVLDNRRVRFDIRQRAAVGAGLKVSSKLLSVARSVEK